MADTSILNSWKEISNYVGRGVRTVQRWEQLYGLPVHRAAGKNRSAVYALSEEIDGWLRAGKMHDANHVDDGARYAELKNRIEELESEARALLQDVATLRGQVESNTAFRRDREKRVENVISASQRLQGPNKKSA